MGFLGNFGGNLAALGQKALSTASDLGQKAAPFISAVNPALGAEVSGLSSLAAGDPSGLAQAAMASQYGQNMMASPYAQIALNRFGAQS